jgi:hypothetical protein
MDTAHDERYSHHEDHEGHEGSDIFAYKLRTTMLESFRSLRKFYTDSELLNQRVNTMSPRSARPVARRPRRPNGFGPQGEGHEGFANYYISISSFVFFASFVVQSSFDFACGFRRAGLFVSFVVIFDVSCLVALRRTGFFGVVSVDKPIIFGSSL